MAKALIQYDAIASAIKKLRTEAETGIKRITADFLVENFFEDIEALRKRGFNFEEIIDELRSMIAEIVPDTNERSKIFDIKAGTLKVYMSRKRKEMAEKLTSKKSGTVRKTKRVATDKPPKSNPSPDEKPTQPESKSTDSTQHKSRATNLDREL